MPHEPTEIYRAESTQQATLLQGLLEDNGIEAMVINDVQAIAGGEIPLGWPSLARVVVPDEQADKARHLVLQFEAQMRQRRQNPEAERGVLVDQNEDDWNEWPNCPRCSQKRQVRCNVCGTAGTDFPLVDIAGPRDNPRVLLFCPTCDDHFQPQFYRRCHACGFDYGDGIRSEGEPRPSDGDGVSPRVWQIIWALVIAAAMLVGYFAWLLS